MASFYYSGQYMMRKMGRSPSGFAQLKASMPAPDGVLVQDPPKSPYPMWSLNTWRKFAKTRKPRLQHDLLEVIEQLEKAERELADKY